MATFPSASLLPKGIFHARMLLRLRAETCFFQQKDSRRGDSAAVGMSWWWRRSAEISLFGDTRLCGDCGGGLSTANTSMKQSLAHSPTASGLSSPWRNFTFSLFLWHSSTAFPAVAVPFGQPTSSRLLHFWVVSAFSRLRSASVCQRRLHVLPAIRPYARRSLSSTDS